MTEEEAGPKTKARDTLTGPAYSHFGHLLRSNDSSISMPGLPASVVSFAVHSIAMCTVKLGSRMQVGTVQRQSEA